MNKIQDRVSDGNAVLYFAPQTFSCSVAISCLNSTATLKQLSLSLTRMSKEVTHFVFAYALRLISRDMQNNIEYV